MKRLLLLMVLVGLVAASCGDSEPRNERSFGAVSVEGALPALPGGGGDPAIGMAAPTVVGTGLENEAVTIEADGTAKMIVFLAHWCPHCQNEVPEVQAWLDAGGLPDGVDLYAVATGTTDERPNYPPGAWLETEGWTPPTVFDDRNSVTGQAFGLTAFPFWVFVDADNAVIGRLTGALETDRLDSIAAELVG